MTQITIPGEGRFTRPSKGQIFGNLWAVKNLDLQANPGKIRLSEKTFTVVSDEDDAQLTVPVKFIRSNADTTDRWWTLVQTNAIDLDGVLFKSTNSSPISAWAQDAIANTPTDACDDMEIFGQASSVDRLIVARDNDLAMMNNGAWTASWWVTTLGQSAMATTNPHLLEQFTNLLIVTDGNLVHTIDDSLVVSASRLVLPKEYQIIWTANDGQRVYFGTRHIRKGKALVFPWNGVTNTYDSPMEVGDFMSFAGCSKNGVMHVINTKGQLLANTGQTFEEIASLPCADKVLAWDDGAARPKNVNANGMAVVGNEIHILLSNQMASGSDSYENFPSGIWVHNPLIGLYHKYSLVSEDTLVSNFGSIRIAKAGALAETEIGNGRFLAGYKDFLEEGSESAANSLVASLEEATDDQIGYFITSQLQAKSVRAFWQRLHVIYKRMFDSSLNSAPTITLKYRVEENEDYYSQATGIAFKHVINWEDSNQHTFSVVSAPTGADFTIGDELEVLNGPTAGWIAHIASFNDITEIYTLDDSLGAGQILDDVGARFMNWTKLGVIGASIHRDDDLFNKIFRIAKRAPWIQFKVVLRGNHILPELEKLIAEFQPSNR